MTITPLATEAALAVVGARKQFEDTMAVDGVDVEVMDGEILALVGPSGCGKTTLLRAIAGLTGLDAGTIRLAGNVVDDSRRCLPPEKRHVGLVFQEHSLFPHLTVLDNVAFGIRDASRSDVRTRAGEALELVKLGRFGARYPHELSGGERQRVALARALAPRPTLMLLDEPFASLDPNLRGELRRDVIAALRATRTAAVFVTHDQGEALASGDRVAVMRAGRIEQDDEPNVVFHEPCNRFVAAFMGEASFLPVADDGQGPCTVLGPVDIGAEGPGRPGVAMVRPDDVVFVADPAGDAEVVAGEFRGTTWNYAITVDDGTALMSNRSHIDRLDLGTRGRVVLAPGHRQVVIREHP